MNSTMKTEKTAETIRFDPEEISAIYFDMDGTIIDPASLQVTESTRRALKALQKKGIRIALCTTRSYQAAAGVPGMEGIDWDGYVLESGCLVLDHDRKTVSDQTYNPDDLKLLFGRAAKMNIPIFYNDGSEERVTVRNSLTDHIAKKYGMGNVPVCPWRNERVCMLTAVSENEDQIQELLAPVLTMTARRGGDVNYDLALKKVTKLDGIQALQKYWHLENAAFGAFGDTEADAGMLAAAEAGFAMPWTDEKASAAAAVKCTNYGGETIEKALQETGLL